MRGRLVRLGMSDRSFKTTAAPSSPRSAGECQMAVTAIDHDGRIVTVTSQRVEVLSASGPSHDYAFTTKIHGGSLKDTMWLATSWAASLRNHATAVSKVVNAIALSPDSDG
jgi:hypothetical protein